MRVRIIRATVAEGRHVAVGEVVDLPPDVARMLCACNKALLVDATEPDPVALTVQAQPAAVRRRR